MSHPRDWLRLIGWNLWGLVALSAATLLLRGLAGRFDTPWPTSTALLAALIGSAVVAGGWWLLIGHPRATRSNLPNRHDSGGSAPTGTDGLTDDEITGLGLLLGWLWLSVLGAGSTAIGAGVLLAFGCLGTWTVLSVRAEPERWFATLVNHGEHSQRPTTAAEACPTFGVAASTAPSTDLPKAGSATIPESPFAEHPIIARASNAMPDRLISCSTDSRIDLPDTAGGDGSEAPIVQWMQRSRSGDQEAIEGSLRISFQPGEKETFAHLSFTPPFLSVPEIEVEWLDDCDWAVKLAAVYPYGCRWQIRRGTTAAAASQMLGYQISALVPSTMHHESAPSALSTRDVSSESARWPDPPIAAPAGGFPDENSPSQSVEQSSRDRAA